MGASEINSVSYQLAQNKCSYLMAHENGMGIGKYGTLNPLSVDWNDG